MAAAGKRIMAPLSAATRGPEAPSHPAQCLLVCKCLPSNELSTDRSLSAAIAGVGQTRSVLRRPTRLIAKPLLLIAKPLLSRRWWHDNSIRV